MHLMTCPTTCVRIGETRKLIAYLVRLDKYDKADPHIKAYCDRHMHRPISRAKGRRPLAFIGKALRDYKLTQKRVSGKGPNGTTYRINPADLARWQNNITEWHRRGEDKRWMATMLNLDVPPPDPHATSDPEQ